VQPSGGFADQFLQPRLDVHVNVFIGDAEGEGSRLDLGQNRVQPEVMAFASASDMMPHAASIAAWAFDPAMSWR
jgi:hypothetical protein